MPTYDDPRNWLNFEPDSTTEVILEKWWDKVKDNKNGPGKYRAHFYHIQHVDSQENMIMSPSNTLHEKIQQTGAEIGATIAITRVGKGKQDTRWMAKWVIGNIDEDRAALWEHGDPDPFDDSAPAAQPTQQAQPAQHPPAPDATPPHQNTQTAQPAQPQGDPTYRVYVPKPDEHWNLQDYKAAEGGRRRLLAFEAVALKFDHIFPADKDLSPGQLLHKIEILGNLSAGTGVELAKAAYHDWEAPGPKLVLKEDVPGYEEAPEPEPEPEPEVLTFQNDQEALAALASDAKTFFEIVAEHDYFKGLPGSLSTVAAKKVANQFGFTHPSHIEEPGHKLNVARMCWTFGDFMVKDNTTYAEYHSLLKTAKKFDFPPEVIAWDDVDIPPDVEIKNDVEDALNGDD